MLDEQKCEPCTSSDAPLTRQACEPWLNQLTQWQLIERDGVLQLEKVYRFSNFMRAWQFSNHVAEIAEAEFHHPAILLEWGKVTVTWWSHSLKGLHKNDFICAAKCDDYDLS